ncbi:hypothetical protein K8T06_03100 [bacterium]|nr:hypothetical protein [bacterium]
MKTGQTNNLPGSNYRIRIILDVLILIFTFSVISLGWQLVSSYYDNHQLKDKYRRLKNEIDTYPGLMDKILEEYSISIGVDPLDILNRKLTEIGMEQSIMDISPGKIEHTGIYIGIPVRLRLSPVSVKKLSLLLNQLEQDQPRFFIEDLHLTRIMQQSNDMDITINLVIFKKELTSVIKPGQTK